MTKLQYSTLKFDNFFLGDTKLKFLNHLYGNLLSTLFFDSSVHCSKISFPNFLDDLVLVVDALRFEL